MDPRVLRASRPLFRSHISPLQRPVLHSCKSFHSLRYQSIYSWKLSNRSLSPFLARRHFCKRPSPESSEKPEQTSPETSEKLEQTSSESSEKSEQNFYFESEKPEQTATSESSEKSEQGSSEKTEQGSSEKTEGPDYGESAEKRNAELAPITWKSLALVVVVGSGMVLYHKFYGGKKKAKTLNVKTSGKALLGGVPFDLVDMHGNRKTSEDYKGQYILLYFGFTFCPDICPTELRKMEKALKTLKIYKNMPEVVPLFISIDPDRDTHERLKEYSKEWSPKMQWLTGDLKQIDKVAKSYRVYYSIPTEDELMGDTDYLVDHSIFFYLLNPEGEFLDFFGKNLSAEEVSLKMSASIRRDMTGSS